MADTPKFPEVQGGGSLIIAWQIKDKKVLVVGGGEVGLSQMACASFSDRVSESRLRRAVSSTALMLTPR